jgi:asparaginyl-tRNA synthetase
MLEAEWAFIESVHELCDVAESMLKDVLRAVIVSPDAAILWRTGDTQKHMCLESAASDAPWARLTYSEAIEALQAYSAAHPGAFKFSPDWGKGLQSEHERWLAEQHIRGPVFVTDYPTALKPFYMRTNKDGKTVACFDLLVPQVGELIGGSVREERESMLADAMRSHGLDAEEYKWYLELRKYGGAPHGGFGLGFERLVSWVSGIENVRECIGFPRWAGRMLL